MVSTRKRAAAGVDHPAAQTTSKRLRQAGSPAASASPAARSPQARGLAASPPFIPGRQTPASVAKKGSRGKAFLAAAGIAVPEAPPISPPRLSSKKESAAKAARRAADEAAARASLPRPASAPRRNPLLRQELPRKLNALLDMFAGLQTVYEVMRKRGQRTTYQAMRQAVEEASGRRFLVSHAAQLGHLLPEALSLEWVRLPVAAHSSRTEAQLLITLDGAAAGEAAAGAGAAHAGGELQAARHLLHCRLAGHLVGSYREHLAARAAEAREAGDDAAAAELEEAAAAAAEPPVEQWVPPYPEGAADVPQRQLPPRPDAATPSSRAASPSVLAGAGGALTATAAAVAALPGTPATTGIRPPPSASGARQGLPPVHPGTVERRRLMQRRLSYGGAADGEAAAAAAVAAATPSRAALAAAAGHAAGRGGKPITPLDKLESQLSAALRPQAEQMDAPLQEQQQQQQQQQQGQQQQQQQQQPAAPEVHASQAALAASLAGEQWGGSILSEADASLLASMPEQLLRMSTDGIISLDTLRKLDAAEQQQRRLSSKEAVAAREASAALGELPRTFSRVQRIFGFQGPNALKLRDVVARIRQGAETSSEAQVEAQLWALAEHAPEYLSLKPYGACGTPAVWVNRRANGNAVMARLRDVAAGRHAARESLGAAQ